MDGDFSHSRAEDESFHTDNISDIQEPKHLIGVTQIILFQIDLDPPLGILKMEERRLPHPSKRHDPSGNGDLADFATVVESCKNLPGKGVSAKLVGIGGDAAFQELIQLLTASEHELVQLLRLRFYVQSAGLRVGKKC
jgi:hypothetical protein